MRKAERQEPRYYTAEDLTREKSNEKPLAFLYTACVLMAAMGEWYQLNASIGTYMKVFTLGGLGLAMLDFLKTADIPRVKKLRDLLFLFSIPLLLTLLWSMGLWIFQMEGMSAITRGVSKLMYQYINISCVLSGLYMFGDKALYLIFYGLVGANATVFCLEMKNYGIGPSLMSIIDCYFGGGNTHDFMSQMEMHDMTFCIGLFTLYFITIEHGRKGNWKHVLVGMFFFLLGYKRIALAGFAVAVILSRALDLFKHKTRRRLIYVVSSLMALGAIAWVVMIKSGFFITTMQSYGVELAGRDRIYAFMDQFYDISPTYMGRGFEYTVSLLRNMRDTDTQVIHVTGIHNDILKQYIELGFWGFLIWIAFTYLYQPYWYMKKYGEKAARLMLSLSIYTFITYLTDNTIYYFWLSMCLRAVMGAYVFSEAQTTAIRREKAEAMLLTKEDIIRLERS